MDGYVDERRDGSAHGGGRALLIPTPILILILGSTLAALAGCAAPLSLHDPFFNPLNTTAAGIEEQVSGAVAEGRTRQALVQGCIGTPRQGCPPQATVPPRPTARALRALEAWEAGTLPKHPAGEHAGAL